jgi:protein-S-isoprenylcysteine O-methyltransferase Ste14
LIADVLLVAAWAALALDDLRQARRYRPARAAYGHVIARWPRSGVTARVALAAALVAGFIVVERQTGRWSGHPALTAGGLALAAAGLVVHGGARRALGPLWSGAITVRARHEIVQRGPYAVVRHPLYLGILLLALGTLLAHPSPATACVAAGIALGIVLKIPREERALAALPDSPYAAYAARVPALVPRPDALLALIRGKPR